MKYDNHQRQNIFQKFYFHSARKQIANITFMASDFFYKAKLSHYFSSALRKAIDNVFFA